VKKKGAIGKHHQNTGHSEFRTFLFGHWLSKKFDGGIESFN